MKHKFTAAEIEIIEECQADRTNSKYLIKENHIYFKYKDKLKESIFKGDNNNFVLHNENKPDTLFYYSGVNALQGCLWAQGANWGGYHYVGDETIKDATKVDAIYGSVMFNDTACDTITALAKAAAKEAGAISCSDIPIGNAEYHFKVESICLGAETWVEISHRRLEPWGLSVIVTGPYDKFRLLYKPYSIDAAIKIFAKSIKYVTDIQTYENKIETE